VNARMGVIVNNCFSAGGEILQIYARSLHCWELESCQEKPHRPMFSSFNTIPTCDEQRDRQTLHEKSSMTIRLCYGLLSSSCHHSNKLTEMILLKIKLTVGISIPWLVGNLQVWIQCKQLRCRGMWHTLQWTSTTTGHKQLYQYNNP